MRDGWPKYIARVALNGKLPDEVIWRESKLGWPVPDAEFISLSTGISTPTNAQIRLFLLNTWLQDE